jgi:uncharacterized protein YciI
MTEEAQPRERRPTKDIPRNLEPYFLAFLFKGDRWNDPEDAEDLLPRQLAFLRQQVEAGRYLLSGPVTDEGPLVGISILTAGSAAEALALASEDPAVLPSLKDLKITYPA